MAGGNEFLDTMSSLVKHNDEIRLLRGLCSSLRPMNCNAQFSEILGDYYTNFFSNFQILVTLKCTTTESFRCKNNYFDFDVKTSPSCKSKVRLMCDENYSHKSFSKLEEEKTPIELVNILPIKSGRHFINAKTFLKKS